MSKHPNKLRSAVLRLDLPEVEEVNIESENIDEVNIEPEIIEEVNEPAEPVVETVEEPVVGIVVNADFLRLRKEPSLSAGVLWQMPKGTVLVIDEAASTSDFYSVATETGLTGYCMKKFVEVKSI